MKIFKLLGQFLALILVLVFVISMFTSILVLAVDSQLFSPDFYLNVLADENFFERLPALAAGQIRYAISFDPCVKDPQSCENQEGGSAISSSGPPSYFEALSESDWELLLTELLPSDWLENQTQTLVTDLATSTEGQTGQLNLSLSLRELKDRLGGEAGIQAISQMLDTQPECSKDDLLEMTRILEGNQEQGKDFLSCQPPDDFIQKYTPQLEVLIRRSLRDVPDEIDLLGGAGGPAPSVQMFGVDLPLSVFMSWVRWVVRVSPLVNVVLLLVIALLGAYSFHSLGRWWGYPLAISGLLGLAVALLIGPLSTWLSSSFLLQRTLGGINPELFETARDLALEITRTLFRQVRNYALIVTGIGFAVIVSASALKPGRKQETSADSPADPQPEPEPLMESEQPEEEEVFEVSLDEDDAGEELEFEETDSEE